MSKHISEDLGNVKGITDINYLR